jgi:DNA-binding MarR family transcriptional regulator
MTENVEQADPLRALSEIDKTIHEPARLAILMYLYSVDEADAVFLFNATKLTWGNLSSHVSKLEEAGFVKVAKGFVGKKPRTLVELTEAGREALETYLETMRNALGRSVPK